MKVGNILRSTKLQRKIQAIENQKNSDDGEFSEIEGLLSKIQAEEQLSLEERIAQLEDRVKKLEKALKHAE